MFLTSQNKIDAYRFQYRMATAQCMWSTVGLFNTNGNISPINHHIRKCRTEILRERPAAREVRQYNSQLTYSVPPSESTSTFYIRKKFRICVWCYSSYGDLISIWRFKQQINKNDITVKIFIMKLETDTCNLDLTVIRLKTVSNAPQIFEENSFPDHTTAYFYIILKRLKCLVRRAHSVS